MKKTKNILKLSRLSISTISFLTEYLAIMTFESLFFDINYYVSVFVAILLSIIIELMSLFFSLESLKMYDVDTTNFYLFLAIAVLFYSLSFFLSVSGSYNYVEQKTNKNDAIIQNIDSMRNNELKIINERILLSKENINRISQNPSGWSRGERKFLTSKQLNNIASEKKAYNELLDKKKIINLRYDKNRSNLLKNDDKKANKRGEVATIAISILLVIQIVITFILARLIAIENKSEHRKTILTKSKNLITDFVHSQIERSFLDVQRDLNKISYGSNKEPFERSKMDGLDGQNGQKKELKVTGFVQQKMNVQPSKVERSIQQKQNAYLAKYPKVVKLLLNSNKSLGEIAKATGVNKSTVFNIKNVFK